MVQTEKMRRERPALTVIRRGLAITALTYTAMFLIWRVLLVSPLYARVWQLQLSEVFASWFYLPLVLLALAGLLLGARVALLILVVPTLFFASSYGPQFLPHSHALAATEEARPTLRVMTWNMLYNRDRSGEFAAVLETQLPDVVALQEVGWGMEKRLQDEFGTRYPYQFVHRPGSSTSLALLSRFPILDAEAVTNWGTCQCLQAQLDFHGQPITVINTHVTGPLLRVTERSGMPRVHTFENDFQRPIFDALAARVQAVETPLILMGDFNTTESQPNLRRLTGLLSDAYSVAGKGMGYTFPTSQEYAARGLLGRLLRIPFIRIDHILYDASWQAKRAWTGDLSESDHRYVIADLNLRRLPAP